MNQSPQNDRPRTSQEVGDELLGYQTPEHRAQAARVFDKLMAGYDVDDIKDEIKKFATIEQPRPRRETDDARPEPRQHGTSQGRYW